MRAAKPSRGLLAVLAGVALLVLGIVLAVDTERSVAAYRMALQQQTGAVRDPGDNAPPRPDPQSGMVRISGVPQVVGAPYDPDFNQHAVTPVLTRHVQMFQWREVRQGGSVSYALDWADAPQDSSRFVRPEGHANPGAFPIVGKHFDAGSVELDGHKLDAALVQALPGSVTVAPNIRSLPANLAASFVAHDGALVTSATPDAPRLGDLRVSWTAVPLQQVTIIARVEGDKLSALPDAAGSKSQPASVGGHSLPATRSAMPSSPAMTGLRRVLAILLAGLGAGLLRARGRTRLDPWFLLGGGLLAVGAVAGMPWLGSSPSTAAVWLTLALVGFGLLWWRQRASASPSDPRGP